MKPYELRRVGSDGTTYWIRSAGIHGWALTAEGVCIAGPYPEWRDAVAALESLLADA